MQRIRQEVRAENGNMDLSNMKYELTTHLSAVMKLRYPI
jgi:hypothetical protein